MLTQNITKHSKKYTPLTQGTNVTKILKLTNKTREENSELEDREVREREEEENKKLEVEGVAEIQARQHTLWYNTNIPKVSCLSLL